MSKKIENVEFLIKIEERNKKQVTDNFQRHYSKLNKFINKYEQDIDESMKNLVTKERKICDVQKNKFALFKDEIQKYDKILKELENRQKELKDTAKEALLVSEDYYNQKCMIYEDMLAYKREIKTLRDRNENITQSLKVIEDSYPKEFEFLLNDIISEKEIRVMAVQNKQMGKDIEKLNFDIQRETVIKQHKEEDIEKLKDDVRTYEHILEKNKNSQYLINLEKFITDSVTDTLQFETIKSLIQEFYVKKNFDLENEVNVILFKKLQDKMKIMRAELMVEKNEKIIKKNYAELFIDEMKALMRDNLNVDKKKITKEVEEKQAELDKIVEDITKIDLKLKKREALFNKYLISIKQRIKKSPPESYFENNTSLLVENEFNGKIKNDIMNEIEKVSII